MSIKEKLVLLSPYLFQNTAVTVYNTYQYKIRNSGKYRYFRKYYSEVENFSQEEINKEIEKKKTKFFNFVKTNSQWYENQNFSEFLSIPILNKEDIINNIDSIKTLDEREGLVSLTGGTTGASMKVVYTKSDMQERFAILDHFRAQHGYKLGKKTAWFSGKNLISEKQLKKGICSHYDYMNKIRFYSTFHINQKNFDSYWQSLNDFQPEFIVGFPSSVYEICEIADSRGLKLKNKVRVFFPTAETVMVEHRELIFKIMGCRIVDQYASSEGAPFILECSEGSLHIHPLTGIFEVVDSKFNPSSEGEILVTSFTTHGTPLIRYRIGDSIKLAPSSKRCACGSVFQLVERIDGRSTDYILSPTHGKVNLGNISNSTKNIEGIIKFQVLQTSLKEVKVLVVGNDGFTVIQRKNFKTALQERLGPNLLIEMEMVDEIAREKSGKFRLVKNALCNNHL